MPDVLGILKGSGSALQFLTSLLKSGIPGADVLSRVQAAGYNLTTSTANLAINYLTRAVFPAAQQLAALPDDTLPNLASIPITLTKTLRNFSYLVKLTGQSQFSGQLEDRYVSVSTNSLLTKEQAVDAAISISQEASKSGGINGADGEVQSIGQNAAGLQGLDTILPAFSPILSALSGNIPANLQANKAYLNLIAQGPVTPIIFSLTGEITDEDIVANLDAFTAKYGQ